MLFNVDDGYLQLHYFTVGDIPGDFSVMSEK